MPDIISGGFGGAGTAPRIPDRPGKNADMPYFLNVFTAPENGAEVVNANCLMCHGGMVDGQLIIGLGNATADFTRGAGGGITDVPLTDDLLDLLGLDEAERSQLKKIGGRGAALGPLTKMRTIGMNPAELFAVILMVHHDRDTLDLERHAVHAARRLRRQRRHDRRPAPHLRSAAVVARAQEERALLQRHGARRSSRHDGAGDVGVRRRRGARPGRRRGVPATSRRSCARCGRRPGRAPSTRRWRQRGKTVFTRDCAGCHGDVRRSATRTTPIPTCSSRST